MQTPIGSVSVMGIRENLAMVRERIGRAALRAGRDPAGVSLVAVTKTLSVGLIREALSCGLTDFGENYAQEFRDKRRELEGERNSGGGEIKWHFIGVLQSNKVKYLVGRVELIHSLDAVNAAAEIDKRSRERGIATPVLIEVNLTGDPKRGGVLEEEIRDFLSKVAGMRGVSVRGLMTMPPYAGNPEEGRPYFRRLREIRDRYSPEYSGLVELSMGMSGDYEVAIEEGATYVRIGSAIFGPRPY